MPCITFAFGSRVIFQSACRLFLHDTINQTIVGVGFCLFWRSISRRDAQSQAISISLFSILFLQLNGTESTMTPQQQQTHTSIRLALSPYRPPVPMTCPAKTKVTRTTQALQRVVVFKKIILVVL